MIEGAIRKLFLTLLMGSAAVGQTPNASSGVTIFVNDKQVGTMTAADLDKLPRHTAILKEPKDEMSYDGALLKDVLEHYGVPFGKEVHGKALSTYVLATAHDGYQVVYALAELEPSVCDSDIMVADQTKGQNLPDTQGQFRVVVPHDKKPMRSLRMLERIDVVQLRK